MYITIETSKIKKGMFINLCGSRLTNPFCTEEFLLLTNKQIDKLKKAGITNVLLDTEQSRISLEKPNKNKMARTNYVPVIDEDIYCIALSA